MTVWGMMGVIAVGTTWLDRHAQKTLAIPAGATSSRRTVDFPCRFGRRSGFRRKKKGSAASQAASEVCAYGIVQYRATET